MSDNSQSQPVSGAEFLRQMEHIADRCKNGEEKLSQVFMGQPHVVHLTFATMLCNSHMLMESVPGLGKSTMVENIGPLFNLHSKVQQFRSDLLPGDLIGTEIFDPEAKLFTLLEGPCFTNVFMADEINRATPRTQGSLLQMMQEKRVSVNGRNYMLPRPFHVLATQNPLEQEGVYALPEAQMDRFLFKIAVTYPERGDALKILLASTSTMDFPKITEPAFEVGELQNMQALLRKMPLGEDVAHNCLAISEQLRPGTKYGSPLAKEFIKILGGPGPRNDQALVLGAKAMAMMDGRATPTMDDVLSIAESALNHRIILNNTAKSTNNSFRRRVTEQDIIDVTLAPFRPKPVSQAASTLILPPTLTGAAGQAFPGAAVPAPATAPADTKAPTWLPRFGLRR